MSEPDVNVFFYRFIRSLLGLGLIIGLWLLLYSTTRSNGVAAVGTIVLLFLGGALRKSKAPNK